METIKFIDADSHIEEGPGVFDHIESRYAERKPQIITVAYSDSHRLRDKAWIIDGRLIPRPFGYGPVNFATPVTMEWAKRKPVSIESQSLSPASARVQDFDRLGMLQQVVYTTIFLSHVTADPHFETALWRAWNRWMAASTASEAKRLKWVGMIPFWDPHAAQEELRFCKENGSVGAYAMGTMHDRLLSDKSFDPVYGLAAEMGLPICVHIAWAHRGLHASADSMLAADLLVFEQSLVHALYAFVCGGVLERFPTLKVGLIEGYLGHYPLFLDRADHWREMDTVKPLQTKTPPRKFIEEGRLFVTCDGDEPGLPGFVKAMGEDQVMLMADFPHVHYDGDTLAGGVKVFRERTDLELSVKEKIASQNAIRFYGL